MQMSTTPQKPFTNYKWRWAEYTPTEGLNQPLRFLGVLRVLHKHQGERVSSISLRSDLEIVEKETEFILDSKVRLARTTDRNLLRSSGRYWQALGVLDHESRSIRVTDFGEKVAIGAITQTEFALGVIKTLTLPNEYIENDISEWQKADLKIKPLELIIKILLMLYNEFGAQQSHLLTSELIEVIVPLAGAKVSEETYVNSLIAFRNGSLNISNWPNCAPEANDRRMVREFLLFLWHYGFCSLKKERTGNDNNKFSLVPEYLSQLEALNDLSFDPNTISTETAIRELEQKSIIQDVERVRVNVEILSRSQQPKFRRNVLAGYESSCLLTGERLSNVLQACHIVPVKYKGLDDISNSFCFRSDVHVLFDTGHIRIDQEGQVHVSQALEESVSYSNLPKKVAIPQFVNREAIDWRWKYYF